MGIHVIISWKGMILNFIADWAARIKMPKWLKEPLFDCPICQCPWWGTLIYWTLIGSDIREWIIVVLTAMGINSVIVWALRNK